MAPDVPVLKFPTTIVLVDDNQAFLEAMTLKLSDKYQVKAYCNVQTALKELERGSRLKKFIEKSFRKADLNESDIDISHPVFDYNSIAAAVYDNKRFSEISIIVSDYAMPGQLNGIELCSRIKNLPCRKIILTGEADNKTAVDAFNKKLIDRFLHKDTGDFIQNLVDVIDEEIENYFRNISFLVPGWEISGKKKQEKYKELFKDILHKYNIVEYYQINEYEYLMLSRDAKINWLVFQTKEQQQYYIDIAIGNEADKNIIEKLKSNAYLMYLYSDYEKGLPVEKWDKYIFPAKGKVSGLLYTVIEDNKFSLSKGKIKSFCNV